MSGIVRAAAIVFFAYIGFDAVSTLAEESKNPQRDLPRGMLYSLVICTVVYIILALVLTGMVSYTLLGVSDPLAEIFQLKGVKWMLFIVSIAAVVAMTSVLLVFQMGQPRIWMSMSRDGLLPKRFASIHPKYKTPGFATIITGLVVGIPIFFTDENFVLDFTSIGTLFAFVLVCGGILLLKEEDRARAGFKVPYYNGKYIIPGIFSASILVLKCSTSPSSILISVLEKVEDFSLLNEREICWINKLTPKYNTKEGGNCARGWHHSEESKKKMSKTTSKMYIGEGNPFYGKSHSKETKEKIRATRLGKPLSKEHKEKIKAAYNPNRFYKKVIKMDINGTVELETFDSVSDAAKSVSVNQSSLSNCLRGKTKTCANFKWKYYES